MRKVGREVVSYRYGDGRGCGGAGDPSTLYVQSSNGPVKKSMREKAVERRNINKEHNSNFKAGYIPIDEDRLHKTGLRGRKGNLAICVIVLLFILAVINLIITFIIWAVIRIGPNGCDSMEFHDSGLLRFKQDSDMGIIHPLYKSTVGGRRNEDLVIVGENQPIVFQQGETRLSVEKNKTSITSDIGMEFVDPRTQNTLFSTDYNTHEFHLPSGVKILNVLKASTERITSNATSDLNIKVDGRAIVRGNEGVFIMGKTIEFLMGGNMELKADKSIILNGSVMVSTSRLPSSSHKEQFNNGDWERYKLCMCSDGTLFRVQVKSRNMGCQTSVNPC
ncbi:Beta-sarcoglycan, partial [Varanus komodoensis]